MKESVRLRPARLEDAQLLLQWRNDPLTRAQSLQQQTVVGEDHLLWLQASMQNPTRQLFIAERNVGDGQGQRLLLGTVRFDVIDGAYELSWTVAPEQRGKGWGKRLVAALIDRLPPGAIYTAVVLHTNPASQRIANSLAMHERERRETHLVFEGRKQTL